MRAYARNATGIAILTRTGKARPESHTHDVLSLWTPENRY